MEAIALAIDLVDFKIHDGPAKRSETLRRTASPQIAVFGLLLLLSARVQSTPAQTMPRAPSGVEAEFFEKSVRPILVERCWRCHGNGDRPKGGLRFTSRPDVMKGGESGVVVVAGEPAKSSLIEAIRYEHDLKMPPAGKLADREIDVLTRWIALGLPWPESSSNRAVAPTNLAAAARTPGFHLTDAQRGFWAFQPVKAGNLPPVNTESGCPTPIDQFLLADLKKQGLTPSAPADRHTLLRRATFDLIGLPPTPDEIDDFLADRSPSAFAKVIDRLLASPRYGECWGRHWLDVVRYADARDLIQLPAESDFREAWRYRDWVVESFNRDLPFPEFIRSQVAGDLLPASRPGGINKEGLIATGLLAIADFVPGDVDKEQMIADYVNDEIDVVSKAFLGLSIACARCHDHKFDPISTEDYYALAGIFFSTRLIPGPVPGNTPLVRVPLLPPDELKRINERKAADGLRRTELERLLPIIADRAYVESLRNLIAHKFANYLVAAAKHRAHAAGQAGASLPELARKEGLNQAFLQSFVAYLDRVVTQPSIARHPVLQTAAAGKLGGVALEKAATSLQRDLAESANSKSAHARVNGRLIHLRADDPHLVTDRDGRVTLWPNRADLPEDARPAPQARGPAKTIAEIGGQPRTVLRFDGDALLELRRPVPLNGSLFVVFRTAESGPSSERLLGWEDSDAGKHGLGLMLDGKGQLHAIVRNDGQSGDLVDARPQGRFELVTITWGPRGVTLHRGGRAAGSSKGIDRVSADPNIRALRLGGPGSGGSPRFRGDLTELRVYDRQLSDQERELVETELLARWFAATRLQPPPVDLLAELHHELLSAHGPFWVAPSARMAMLSASERSQIDGLTRELEALKKKSPVEIPQAVVVQDGGPKGTRHEGFKDAHVFLRGNHARLGKLVPRGVPHVLVQSGLAPWRIKEGSGRRELAEWLASPENPLPARVMANRIWQHHFGTGLVRTPNDFGIRGERPSNPGLLDWLAARFVASGWSVKAMHRMIMLSSAYQRSSKASARALEKDPENHLFGRMNRRRLDAEAIRDSLLAVGGRLDNRMGGPSFADLNSPRRTLYLQSVRTGATSVDFGRLFDRADPGSIVAARGESVVAPQALFFLNDPFVSATAQALANRVTDGEHVRTEDCIRRVYTLALGRPPAPSELELGVRILGSEDHRDKWTRYCHLILCQNEFIYLD